MEIKHLLEVRKNIKKRKPEFIRQDAHKKARVKGDSWRKPKGWNSKMRQGLKGYRKCVTVGYKSPSKIRGLTREGLEKVRVARKEDISVLDPKKHALVVSAGIGTRKKIEVLQEAIDKNFQVTNYKDAQEYLNKINEALEKKRKKKKEQKEVKEEKQKEKEEVAKKKEEEEKKQQEESEKQEKSDEKTSQEKEEEKSLDEKIEKEEEEKQQQEKKEEK